MKHLLFLLLPVIALVSCDKINLQTANYNIPVVEAYLMPGSEVKVIITRQMVFESEDSTELSLPGLNVQINDGSNWYTLNNSTDDSLYTSSEITVSEGKVYTLQFEYNDLTVTSETEIPVKPSGYTVSDTLMEAFSMGAFEPGERPEMPDPDTITWSNPEEDYYMLVIKNIESSPDKINADDNHPARTFRNEPVQSGSQIVNAMNFNYYGYHQLILYRLNSEYAALYEQLSTTSLDLTSPPSNIENGLGIFTGVNTDTLTVNVVETEDE